jgi:asparagine synthase (glutamine-hydrolysing)
MSGFLLAIPRTTGPSVGGLDRAHDALRALLAAPDAAGRTLPVIGEPVVAAGVEARTVGGAVAWASPDGDVVVLAGRVESVRPVTAFDGRDATAARVVADPLTVPDLHALWQRDGAACFDSLAGEFALALWDAQAERLHVLVDSLAIGSAFVRVLPDCVVVSTEQAALLALRAPIRFDHDALADIVSCRLLAGTRTCWRDVRQVPWGVRCVYGRDGEHTELPAPRFTYRLGTTDVTRSDARARLESALRGNLERLRDSGVAHVVVLLSGGIDSSVITALAAQVFPHVTAVTYQIDDFENPELERAQEVARRLRVPMVLARVSPQDVARLHPYVLRRLQEPPLHFNNPALVRMQEVAADIAPVVLSGDIAGLYGLQLQGQMRRLIGRHRTLHRLPAPMRRVAAAIVAATPVARLRRLAPLLTQDMRTLIVRSRTQPLKPAGAAVLPSNARRRMPSDDLVSRVYDDSVSTEDAGVLWADRIVEGAILRRNTRLSAPVGLRYHYPLLDADAIDLVTSLPVDLRFDPIARAGKPLLRDLCTAHVGADVTGWKKLGFPSPDVAWMAGPLRGALEEALADHSPLAEFISMPAVRALPLTEHHALLWRLMTLAQVLVAGSELAAHPASAEFAP